MKTWESVNLPKGRKLLTCKRILREITDGRLKPRLFACGFDQQ